MPGIRAMKILLAEDDPVSRLLMRRILEKFGYEVIVAEDGRRAAEILSQPDGPRLALVDWMMPELDGISLCREVRSHQTDDSYIYKWGSCLSTVTTTACGFVFGRESAKADSEWVA